MNNQSIKLLIVEDNQAELRMIRMILAEVKGFRFNIEHVESLSDALDVLEKTDPDAVLLDLGLPDSIGLETFRSIYAKSPHLPIVVFTIMGDEELATQAVREGAQDYLVKREVNSAILSRAIRYSIERKQVEKQIKAALKEKEVLLKEIHHRVKNNLQAISSLLSLQSRYIKDEQALEVFKNSQERVRAMALVHEKLYQSGDLSNINFREYINNLVKFLFDSYHLNPGQVQLKMQIEDVVLDIERAIPLGLIINELISNSLKHAFPDNRRGELRLNLWKSEDKEYDYTLIIGDNGIGYPRDLDFRNSDSLGLVLVNSLVKQLHGVIDLERNNGTTFTVKFKKSK